MLWMDFAPEAKSKDTLVWDYKYQYVSQLGQEAAGTHAKPGPAVLRT